jgi:phenazine biosynthesis protein phzE
VAETRAKAAGVLAAAGIETGHQRAGEPGGATSPATRLGHHPAIREALERRNDRLARFWLEPPGTQAFVDPDLRGRRVLVVDNEDIFVGMLAHQLRGLGLDVTFELWSDVQFRPDFADPYDFVIVGPGPGDPLDTEDPRIAAVLRYTKWLLNGATPFVSVCLGHQALAARLGIEVYRKEPPSQGERIDIEWFGRRERAGFYNTFAARSDRDRVYVPAIGATVLISRDPATGEVYGMRGPGFASAQFHPESLLTENGPALVGEMVRWAMSRRGVDEAPADAGVPAAEAAAR